MEEHHEGLPAEGGRAALADPTLGRLQSQNELLLTLFRVSAQLAAELGTDDLAPHVVESLVDALPRLDAVALWLFDRGSKRLRLAAARGKPHAPQLPSEPLELRLAEGAVGSAVRHRESLLVPDRATYMDALRTVEGYSGAMLEQFAAGFPPSLRVTCLPLYLGVIPIGALELFEAGDSSAGVEQDMTLLQAFADQLAVVLRNTQIYAEMSAQHRRLQAFDAVVTAITAASDLPHMLEQVLAVTVYVVGAECGAIALQHDDHVQLEVSTPESHGVWAPGTVISVDQRPIADLVETEQPLLEHLDTAHPWAELLPHGVVAVGLVPLLAAGGLVGMMLLGVNQARAQRLDWASLVAFGNQIGIAVANHQLYNASQRERRQLAGVIASIAEGVLICDRDGRLLLTNDAAEGLVGHALPVGTPMDELAALLSMRRLDGSPMPVAETPLARSFGGDIYQNYEVGVTSGAGRELVVSCSGAPLLADDGSIDGAVVVFRDMTAYKQHEALRDEFVAVAAHELRAPLAAIKGYTDLLVQRETRRHDATERDRRGITMLSRQVEHLVRLVDNLLDVSRLDAGRLDLYLQPTDLITLVEHSIERISAGDSNHEFWFNGPPSLQIVADQLRLQQVLTNLLSNAARYSAAGTLITVEVWTEPCTLENGVVVSNSGDDQCVVIAVRDQGVGMTPEVQAKVFDRYYRANTKTAASGLGLGVYISREIVQLHGGLIRLESEPGVGTSFYVILPVVATGTP